MAYKVQIVNIENNVNNILLTDDLTIELLKVRYNWILNASIKNAVLGLDDYGLVWYSGEWICGEWEDGTWYSGIFHDGIWKKGRWYSYLLDKSMILTKRFVIIEEDKMYSQFLNGKWWNGEWHNGIFGNDNDVSGMTSTQVISESVLSPYWYNGTFYTGLFKNSVWKNGIFYNGTFKNSYWMNGKFYNGYFDNYEWWSGAFYGGDFVKGDWRTGTFNQIKTDILARFGTQSGTTSDGTFSTWESGVFENGQFMSGLNVDASGNTIASDCHHTTHWKDGTYNNGLWYGGHFEKGLFNYGKWYGGIFNTDTSTAFTSLTTWKNGLWYDGLWINGIFKSGMFFGGMWLSGIFENGFLISEYQGDFTSDLKTNVVPTILPPPPPPPTYSVPSVTTDSLGTPTYYDCDVNCTVINDGGLATVRGVCYSSVNSSPTLDVNSNNYVFYDLNTGIGTYTIKIFGLTQNTTYYVRSFATNSLGTNYGNVMSFTSALSTGPSVLSLSYTPHLYSMTLVGKIVSNNGSLITEYGFVYSINPNLTPMTTFVKGTTAGNIGYSATINGLSTDVLYYWAAYAKNPNPGYGVIMTGITTSTVPVVVTASSVTNITQTTATSGGNVTSDGGHPVLARGVEYWSTLLGAATSNGSGMGVFVSNLTDLESNTFYHVRAYATNSVGTGYGAEKTFTTSSALVPTVITQNPATNITSTGAQMGGNVTSENGSTVTQKGIIYAWNGPIANDYCTSSNTGTILMPFGSYIVDNQDLLSYSLIAMNGTLIDSDVSKPLPFPQPDGYTQHDSYYATTPSVEIIGTPSSGLGIYSNIVTIGLIGLHTYHYKAFAKNTAGTGYGAEVVFMTSSSIPVVTTTVATLTSTGAISGGNVTSDGGTTIQSRGISFKDYCTGANIGYILMPYGSRIVENQDEDAWVLIDFDGTIMDTDVGKPGLPVHGGQPDPYYSITGWPELTNANVDATTTIVIDQNPTWNGTGIYTDDITGLTDTLTYYLKAYAKNSAGTGYGADISFVVNLA
jgi:hypothetical protein